jgi:hypothetical protein
LAASFISSSAMSAPGTSLPSHDVRSHVGIQGKGGLVMLGVSFVDPDPERPCSALDHLIGNKRALLGCKTIEITNKITSPPSQIMPCRVLWPTLGRIARSGLSSQLPACRDLRPRLALLSRRTGAGRSLTSPLRWLGITQNDQRPGPPGTTAHGASRS